MILAEPPRSPYDVHFQVLGIPVRVSPMFWLGSAILGAGGTGRFWLMCIGCVFVSILVHELGHALVMRRFGESPRVVLTLFGGLAIHQAPAWSVGVEKGGRSSWRQILISLAGPGAGFLFAALVAGGILIAGGRLVSEYRMSHGFVPRNAAFRGGAGQRYGAVIGTYCRTLPIAPQRTVGCQRPTANATAS